MKEFWLKENECTGCSACENTCKFNAIKLKTDRYGFKYPEINNSCCIECNACDKICRNRLLNENNKYFQQEVYAAWSKLEHIRFRSTSGGAFYTFASNYIKNGGLVSAAKYNKNNMVEHCIIENEESLYDVLQSKYLQSDLNDIFKKIESNLKNGKSVLFCGAPCQVAGLKAFLKTDYTNLFTIDFICRGMNSPKAYRSWLDELEKINSSEVINVWFKYKNNGWKKSPFCTKITFKNGNELILKDSENLYMRGYLNSNLYIRPSCGNCQFKGLNRKSDITLADFWAVDKELDDDKGTSMIIVNSKKGKDFFEKIKDNFFYVQRNIDEITKGNVCFNSSVEINKKSKKFLESLDNNDFSCMLKKYSKESIFERGWLYIKKILGLM